jgi:hypothetical protein
MDGKVEMTLDSFKNILDMINSPDEENKIVALQCIEHMDYRSNIAYVVMILKNSNLAEQFWLENAPKAYNYLKTLDFQVGKAMTFKRIFGTLIKVGVSQEDLQFFFDIFGEELKRTMEGMGYDLLDRVELKLIYKDGSTDK